MNSGAPAAASFHRALSAAGWTWTDLAGTSEQIILFGSRAGGLAGVRSDWDILVVGDGQTRSRSAIDLVWVTARELATREWLTSELAGHVARWGHWLRGEPEWTRGVRCGAEARDCKDARLASRLAALERAWIDLAEDYRTEYRTLLRRDLQRRAVLARGEPVPPTRVLDDSWGASAVPQATMMLQLGSAAGVCSAFFEVAIAPHRGPTGPSSGSGRPRACGGEPEDSGATPLTSTSTWFPRL
jgi:hypothetical protein